MTFRLSLSAIAAALALAVSGMAQTQQAPDPQAAAASTEPPSWSVGPIDFSGLIDGYYSLNFNHPESRTNNLRNFDARANQFSLNMAKLTMEHTADPVGFRVDLGFGRAFELFHFAEPKDGIDVMRNVMQAYVSLKPPKAGGLQLDFGKFVTSAGAEPTETHLNWNYSRSLIYANGPYYHFGARATMPLNSHFSVGAQLVNGWNTVEDINSGKTVGLTTALTSGMVSWYNNYYVGPEKAGLEGNRHFYDGVLLLTPSSRANFYVNFDYGVDKLKGGGKSSWIAVAGAARIALNDWFALSPRVEHYYDRTGFITGTKQKIKEFTMTGEFKMKEGFLTRLEYRRDWSDVPFFDRGALGGLHKNQDTLLVGFVAYFGPGR
ncbi:MAG: porin [Bryobacteraceae bacterium]